MSKGRKKPSLRDLSHKKPTPDDASMMLDLAYNFLEATDIPPGTDRLIAISLAALLDHHIEEGILLILKNKDNDTLEELFSEHGALSTFSSKIWMAYSLGTIDETARDALNGIRRIRNVFAHARTAVTFDTDLIARECNKLNPSASAGVKIDKKPTARQNFILTATILMWQLFMDNAANEYEQVGAEDKAKGRGLEAEQLAMLSQKFRELASLCRLQNRIRAIDPAASKLSS